MEVPKNESEDHPCLHGVQTAQLQHQEEQEVVVDENQEESNYEVNKENIDKGENQVLSKEEAEKILLNINPELEYFLLYLL